ncbi:MAG: hypothetical protein IKI72_03905 [Bacteroidales bacterium]|nr:hypothetical protein [Bacteroidales bacterium]
MTMASSEAQKEYYRRYYEAHREAILAQQKAYRSTVGEDGLTPWQRRYRKRREEILGRQKALRAAGRSREKAEKGGRKVPVAGKPERKVLRQPTGGLRTRGRVCTDCAYYLVNPTCSESFFRVISRGVRIAETCVNYKARERKDACSRAAIKTVTE